MRVEGRGDRHRDGRDGVRLDGRAVIGRLETALDRCNKHRRNDRGGGPGRNQRAIREPEKAVCVALRIGTGGGSDSNNDDKGGLADERCRCFNTCERRNERCRCFNTCERRNERHDPSFPTTGCPG